MTRPGKVLDVRKWLAYVLLEVLLVTYAVTFIAGVGAMKQRCGWLTICRNEWLAYPRTSPDVLGALYPIERVELLRERTEMLRRLGFLLPPAPGTAQPKK
jgi:hypothetical protein